MNVAIIGFGLAGRLAALMLSRRHRVSVFERQQADAPQSAGALAAAMLAPLAESVSCEADLAEQGLASLELWPELLAELDEPVFFQREGSLVVAHARDRGDLVSFRDRLKPLAGHVPQELGAAAIGELEPDLAGRFHGGIYLPGEGQLDNRALYLAIHRTLERRGVRFYFGADEAGIKAQTVDGSFELVVDCRGIGAKEVMPGLRGVRGEVARVHAPEVTLRRPVRLMHPRYPIYIVPKPENEFVIGATEIESQDQGQASVRSTLELLSAAYSVHSGFAEARVLSVLAGLRPAFFDNRPRIEKERGLIRINGLYRHGYLLGPAVVFEALADVI